MPERIDLFHDGFFNQLHGIRMRIRRRVAGYRAGESRGLRAGTSGEFSDHRHYTPGDDLRHLDWPLYWRQQQTFIKVSDSREDCPINIVTDVTASMGVDGKALLACRLAAALGFVGVESGNSVHLYEVNSLVSRVCTAAERSGFLHQFCERINALEFVNSGDVSEGLLKLPHLVRHQGITIVISDFLDTQQLPQALSLMASMSDTVLLHIIGDWENSPVLEQSQMLKDIETGEQVTIHDDDAIRNYRRRFAQHAEELRRSALRFGLRYVHGEVGSPLAPIVLKALNIY